MREQKKQLEAAAKKSPTIEIAEQFVKDFCLSREAKCVLVAAYSTKLLPIWITECVDKNMKELEEIFVLNDDLSLDAVFLPK